MAPDKSETAEKLIFDVKGDVILILTRRSEDENNGKDAPSESILLKGKSPDDASKTVTMLVSSNNMTLASPVFEAMLSDGRFKEEAELLTKGKVEIELPDDDPANFSIIAQVVHGQNEAVSRHVTFNKLVNLAILTEKFQTHKIISCISEKWTNNLICNTPY